MDPVQPRILSPAKFLAGEVRLAVASPFRFNGAQRMMRHSFKAECQTIDLMTQNLWSGCHFISLGCEADVSIAPLAEYYLNHDG